MRLFVSEKRSKNAPIRRVIPNASFLGNQGLFLPPTGQFVWSGWSRQAPVAKTSQKKSAIAGPVRRPIQCEVCQRLSQTSI
jgi:hypothetical protein